MHFIVTSSRFLSLFPCYINKKNVYTRYSTPPITPKVLPLIATVSIITQGSSYFGINHPDINSSLAFPVTMMTRSAVCCRINQDNLQQQINKAILHLIKSYFLSLLSCTISQTRELRVSYYPRASNNETLILFGI